MPIYIEAEKLEKEGWFAARNYQRDEKTMVFESKKMTDFPPADVVEVVRCKDCKHYLYSNEKCGLIDTRLNFYATDKIWTNDCFCAWGERRDDE